MHLSRAGKLTRTAHLMGGSAVVLAQGVATCTSATISMVAFAAEEGSDGPGSIWLDRRAAVACPCPFGEAPGVHL